MKNTLRKIVISTMIAVTAATAAIAPAATVVMASDGFEAIYENGYKYYYSHDTGKYYYADADGNIACDSHGPIEMDRKNAAASSLDKSLYGATRYCNVNDFLALRTGPDSDAAMIAKLAPNAQVTIIGTVGDWVKVYAPSVDSDGYVYGAYLSKSKQASSSKPASTAVYKTVRGTKHYLALRTDTCYDERNEIAKLYNGETVKVLNSNVNGSGYACILESESCPGLSSLYSESYSPYSQPTCVASISSMSSRPPCFLSYSFTTPNPLPPFQSRLCFLLPSGAS